jgi:hypothetical protein
VIQEHDTRHPEKQRREHRRNRKLAFRHRRWNERVQARRRQPDVSGPMSVGPASVGPLSVSPGGGTEG